MAAGRWRWLLWLLVAGGIFAGLAIASGLALRAYAPALARERLESTLTEALGHPVHIEQVALSLWRGRAVLQNLRVEPVPGEGTQPILRLGRLELSIGISSLWRRELVLSRILAQDLDLAIPAPRPGSAPLSLDLPETFAVGPITVRITRIQIQRGHVTYRDPGHGVALDAQGLESTAAPLRRGIDFDIRLGRLALDVGRVRETVTNVAGAGWIHQDLLSLRQLTGRWLQRAFRIAGSVRHPFDAVELDVRVKGEVDLAWLASSFKSELPPLAGIVTLDGAVQGRPDSLEVSGRLAVPTLAAGPVHARDVAMGGRWSQGTLDLTEVTARIFDGTARGSARVRPDQLDATRISFSFQHVSLAALDSLVSTPLNLRGELDLDGELNGDPRRPEAASGRFQLAATRLTLPGELGRFGTGAAGAATEGTLQGRPDTLENAGRLGVPTLAAGPIQARDVAIRGHWNQGTLDLTEVTARIFDGTLRGSARVRPDQLEATRISFSLKSVSLAALGGLVSTPLNLRGELDLDGEFNGDPRRPAAASGQFQLAATRLTLPGEYRRFGAGAASAAGSFRGGVAEITRVTGKWRGVEVEAAGRLGMDGPAGLHITLVASLGSVTPLWDLPPVAGEARVQGDLNGRWGNLEASGQFRATPISLAGSRIDALEVPFRLHGESLEVTAATAALGQSRATVSGVLSWAEPKADAKGDRGPRLHFRAEVPSATLRYEDLGQWLPPEWQGTGRFSMAGRIEGTPAVWQASGALEAPSLSPRSGVPIQAMRAAFTVNQDQLELSQVRAQVYGIPSSGAGVWMWNGNGRATVEVGPADLTRIPNLPAEAGLHGTAKARVQASRRPGNVEASATVSLDGVVIRDVSVGAGSGQFSLGSGEVRGNVTFQEAHLSASMKGSLDRQKPLAVRIEARDFALGPLLRASGRFEDLKLDGTVTALADLSVPLSQPSAAQGTLTLDPLRLSVLGEDWTNDGPIKLEWGAAGLRVDRLTLASRFGSLKTSGRLDPHGPLDLRVDGQFPLAVLASLRPEVRVAGGTLTVTGHVGGSAAVPRITGEATLRDGTLQMRERPETLRDVAARIVLSPSGVRLVEATGSLGRGQIHASGDMTLQEWRLGAYRFTLVGRDVSIAPVEGLQTAWDLDLELVGQGARAQLRGEGRLLQGTVSGRFSLLSLLLSRTPGKAAETSAAFPLRILLKLDDNLRVNMDVARLRAGGTLSLEGTTAEPVILGALQAQEGHITFRNKRWTLISGAVRFIDPRRIQPILEVTARTAINGYDVTLRLSGRPDELLVSLSSSPPLSQDDLLVLVALGTTRGGAGKSSGGAAAGELVRLLAEDILGTTVGGGLGPDQFSLGTGDKNQQTVEMGKQVTEDVRVIYSQSLSGAAKRVVRIEYQVIGPLFLSAEQDFQASFGGDLLLRFRFR